jgi:hypothetical protein
MLVTIKNNILGTVKKNIIYDSFEKSLVTTNHQTGWIFDNSIKSIPLCYDSLLKLNSKEVNLKIKDEYKRMAEELRVDPRANNIKWKYLMKKDDYLEFSKSIIRQVMAHSSELETDYYTNFHKKYDILFSSLLPTKINLEKFKEFQSGEHTSVLNTFQPNSKGFAKEVIYDRFGTSTGRLTVASGPQILTLKKEFRSIMQSRFDGGKIFYIDFKALEATIILSLLDLKIDEDPYEYIMKILNISDRATAKKSFMAYFYSDEKYLDNTFNKQKILDKLNSDKTKNSFKNYFGRKITDNEGKTISYFVQSSGVDISLLGFTKIVEEIKSKNYDIVPLFLIHDAFVVDVPPHDFDKLDLLASVGADIKEFPTKFMLKIDEI